VGELLEITNDQVLQAIALEYKKNIQTPGIRLFATAQPVVLADEYRKDLRSGISVVPADGATATFTVTFKNEERETRRFILVYIENGTASDIRVVATVEDLEISVLRSTVLDTEVNALARAFVVGKFTRLSMGTSPNSFSQMPDRIIQPINSNLIFKITNAAGGPILAGTIDFEASYFRDAPVRSWAVDVPVIA